MILICVNISERVWQPSATEHHENERGALWDYSNTSLLFTFFSISCFPKHYQNSHESLKIVTIWIPLKYFYCFLSLGYKAWCFNCRQESVAGSTSQHSTVRTISVSKRLALSRTPKMTKLRNHFRELLILKVRYQTSVSGSLAYKLPWCEEKDVCLLCFSLQL